MVPLSLRTSCVGAEGVGARGRVLNYVCVHTTTVHVKYLVMYPVSVRGQPQISLVLADF